MKKHFMLFIAAVTMSFIVGCSNDDDFTPPNYITFEQDNTASLRVDIGGSATQEVTVYTADIVSNDRTYELVVDEASTLDPAGYNLPASVTVPGGSNEGTFTVEVSDVSLGLTGKRLIVDLAESEGLYTGSSYFITVERQCEGTEFVIDFEFDGYASEIDWILADGEGNTLVTGGGYEDGTASASRTLCPSEGAYTFTVTDSYGDGLTYPSVGSITLSYAGEEVTVIPGAFGPEEVVNFTLGPDGSSTVDGENTDGENTDGEDTDGGDTDGGDTDGEA